jgi:methyltransferase (TIGR00027 family)
VALEDTGRGLLSASTAEGAAALRAAAAQERDPAVRGPDDLAADFIAPGMRLSAVVKVPLLRPLFRPLIERVAPGAYWFEVVRTRHMDAVLLDEVAAGARQVVILGAGFDTRPYRFADELADVAVFEVDHPITAAVKRQRVAAALGRPPRNVRYVKVDFETQDLRARLAADGFDAGTRTVTVWSGVCMYLDPAAVDATLTWAASLAAGSAIVFDHLNREVLDGDHEPYGAKELLRLVRRTGEPLRFGVPRGTIGDFLAVRGLELVHDLRAEEAKRRYATRSDGRIAGRGYEFGGIALARVPGDG